MRWLRHEIVFTFIFLSIEEFSTCCIVAYSFLCSLLLKIDNSLFSAVLDLFWPVLVADRPALLRLMLLIHLLFKSWLSEHISFLLFYFLQV